MRDLVCLRRRLDEGEDAGHQVLAAASEDDQGRHMRIGAGVVLLVEADESFVVDEADRDGQLDMVGESFAAGETVGQEAAAAAARIVCNCDNKGGRGGAGGTGDRLVILGLVLGGLGLGGLGLGVLGVLGHLG